MQIAIVDEQDIITNVVIFDEPAFQEDDTHKFLPDGLWIGDKYTTSITNDPEDTDKLADSIDELFYNVPKVELIERIVSQQEELETLREVVKLYLCDEKDEEALP